MLVAGSLKHIEDWVVPKLFLTSLKEFFHLNISEKYKYEI